MIHISCDSFSADANCVIYEDNIPLKEGLSVKEAFLFVKDYADTVWLICKTENESVDLIEGKLIYSKVCDLEIRPNVYVFSENNISEKYDVTKEGFDYFYNYEEAKAKCIIFNSKLEPEGVISKDFRVTEENNRIEVYTVKNSKEFWRKIYVEIQNNKELQ